MFKRSTLIVGLSAATALVIPAFQASAAVQTVFDASATSVGTVVTVNSVLVTAILDYSTSFNNETYAVQDSTGATLAFRFAISGARDPGYHPNVGDVLNVTAMNVPFGGNNELNGADSTTVTINNAPVVFHPPVPIVTPITTATVNPDAISILNLDGPDATLNGYDRTGLPLDGVLVKLHNVYFDAAGTTINGHVTNSAGAYTVYDPTIASQTDPITSLPLDPHVLDTTIFFYGSYKYVGPAFDGQTLPSGPVDITGIVTKFSSAPGGYEIYPLSITGLTPNVPEPASIGLLGLGAASLLRRRRAR